MSLRRTKNLEKMNTMSLIIQSSEPSVMFIAPYILFRPLRIGLENRSKSLLKL